MCVKDSYYNWAVTRQNLSSVCPTKLDSNECRELKPAMRAIYSEIVALVTILLVIPAANATSERTFSALRRVKTYLRSALTQTRMNNLITLHVHEERTDALDLKTIANEFTARNEPRRCVFGKF